MKDGRHEQFADWITRYYSNHKYIPDGHSDGELIGKLIRCRDCKHYYEKEWVVGGGSYTTCWYQTIANAQPNDFCSKAERKDNDKVDRC